MGRLFTIASRPNRLVFKRAGRNLAPTYLTYEGTILASTDDAHEGVADGAVDLISSVVYMGGYTGVNTVHSAGYRFTNVTLSQGAEVPFAQLRFVAGISNSEPCLLRIWAQAADNAPTFTSTAGNITSRTKTTAYVDWDVPPWTTDKDDSGTLSPDLSALVSEVVGRAGWVSGNAIVFIIETSPAIADTTFPRRRPRAYDNASPSPARLSINTSSGESPTPPPPSTGQFGDGYDTFGFLGNEAFDPNAPTLKDGTAVTGQMLTYHDSFRGWAVNNSHATTGDYKYVNPSIPWTNDVYNISRNGQNTWQPILHVFRLTGDLTLLDRIVTAAKVWKGHMGTSWRFGYDETALNAADRLNCGFGNVNWHPYNKFMGNEGGGVHYSNYTDIHPLNPKKAWSCIAELAWALHINRNLTSPAGHDYAAELAHWKIQLEGYVKAWSETTTACWKDNYKGETWTSSQGYSRRAVWGTYPFDWKDGSHSGMDGIFAHRYLGLLGSNGVINIPNPENATAFAQTLVDLLPTNAYKYCTMAPYGDIINLRRGAWFKGAPGDITYDSALWTTYLDSVAHLHMQLWLIGAYRAKVTKADMTKLGALYAAVQDGTGGGRFADTRCRTDSTPVCGLAQYSTPTTESPFSNYLYGAAYLTAFEPGDGKLTTVATNVVNTYGGYGNLSNPPNAGLLQAGQFLKEALGAIGDLE